MTLLVTGGAGFIGSNFVELASKEEPIVVLDKLTYAGNKKNLEGIPHHFVHGDINDKQMVIRLLDQFQPRGIINFAAETHVDNSIDDPTAFIQTNINGTVSLLEAHLAYTRGVRRQLRFHQISTDEVYGSLTASGQPFKETTPYDPKSPYSASKAAADHLVRSYGNTYGIDYTITNCSNNFGPKQHPEKLIPKVILNALQDKPVPMYGEGMNIRDWIYVKDHCKAVLDVFNKAPRSETYNIGGDKEFSNKTLIEAILKMMGKPKSLIVNVPDRPGHDFRYAINGSKLHCQFPLYRKYFFDDLQSTIDWYKENTCHSHS